MKKMELLVIGLILVLGAACTPAHVTIKGALVNVYCPNPIKEGIVCSTQNSQGIPYMYVGADTVTGEVSQRDKEIIAQYAKAVLGETRFINPITVSSIE